MQPFKNNNEKISKIIFNFSNSCADLVKFFKRIYEILKNYIKEKKGSSSFGFLKPTLLENLNDFI